MPRLNARQQCISKAVAAYGNASRDLVIQYEASLLDYWTVDSRSCDNLSFFLTALKRHPRLQKAAMKLLPMYAPVAISSSKGVFVVKNIKDASKRAKVRCKKALGELVNLRLTSLLSHPSIKCEVEVVWEWNNCKKAAFKKSVGSLLEHGVSVDELLRLMADMANAVPEELEECPRGYDAALGNVSDVYNKHKQVA